MYTYIVMVNLGNFARAEVFEHRPTLEDLLFHFPSEYHADLREFDWPQSLPRIQRLWVKTIGNCQLTLLKNAVLTN